MEAIVEPTAVIPDIGGPPNRYFFIKGRDTWRDDFINFLEKDLDIDEEISDDESSSRTDESENSD